MHAQKEELGDYIGYRQKFKIDRADLLDEPDAHVDEYGNGDQHGVSDLIERLFDEGAYDKGDHRDKVSEQIDQVERVKHAVDLDESRDPIHHGKGNFLIINVENAGTCNYEKNGQTEREKSPREPFFIFGLGEVKNDHQHRQRQKYRAEISHAVSHQRRLESRGDRKPGVSDVHHKHG